MFSLQDILRATSGKLLTAGLGAAIKGVSIDSRTLKPQDLFIAIKGDRFDGHDFIEEALKKKAAAVISAKDILPKNTSAAVIKVNDTLVALGQIAGEHRRKFHIPVIAVTGSNGKTTTKDMIACVLGARFSVLKNIGTKNNAVGLPMTLLGLRPGYDVCVLEIGTNHFGEVKYLADIASANIGLITNIGPAHLEFLKSLDGVFKEKSDLLRALVNPAIGIINADDVFLKGGQKLFRDRFIISFGIENRAEFAASDIKLRGNKIEFRVNKKQKIVLDTCGFQNVYNALCAIATARLFGMDYRTIALRLAAFSFPEGRLKFVRKNRINFIDDTYNSNPLSLSCALDSLEALKIKGRKILVMGDMLELGEEAEKLHRESADRISRICDCFIGVGELASATARAIREKRRGDDGVFVCATATQARDMLLNKIRPLAEDLVLVKGSRRLTMEEVLR
ncbi:MAG: UDP-N-acetylmuramoyl-tripeptide--D-alanyl-D-alanine ligase [Candidatus Omnitrophica bacterium]|nr:UDP-N-acetylmuramoyl-tripeptide--D-alanyl-D-alanine ligase [Candidatus Omnitrophota bacterium]